MSFANIGMSGPSASDIYNVDVGGVENGKEKMAEPLLQSSDADIDTCARPPEAVVSGAVRAAVAVFGGNNDTTTITGSGGSSNTSRMPPADAFSGTSAGTSSAKYHPPQPVLQLSNYDDEEQQIDFAASSNENSHHHQESDLMQYTTQHSDLDSALLTERNTEISYVHKSMSQISEIQRDLATLVDGQQEDIDAVEDHAEQTAHYAERGRRELEKAYHIWQLMNAKRRLAVKVMGAIVLLWIMAHHIYHTRKEASGGGEGEEGGHDGGAWRW